MDRDILPLDIHGSQDSHRPDNADGYASSRRKRASLEARFVSGSYWHRRPARPLEIIRLGTIAWWSYFFDILTASPETVAGPAGCTIVRKKTSLPSLLMVKFWDKPSGTEFI